MAKIYVASSWRNPLQEAVVRALEDEHDVYDFRDNGLNWSECAKGTDLIDPTIFRDKVLTNPIAKAAFKRDMDALAACEILVLVLPCGRSAHLELGWAAGAGKRTIVLLDTPLSEPELMYRMNTYLCTSIEEVIEHCAFVKRREKLDLPYCSTLVLNRGYKAVTTWRLVDTDNFGGDYPNESFYAVGIPSEHIAEQLAKAYNDRKGEYSPRYLRVVQHIELECTLQPGFEP
jgi:hypothetical protein